MRFLAEKYIGSTSLGLILIFYLLWNLFVFLLYGTDKARARRGSFRIPEKTLLLCAFFMGGIGAFVGMKVFHHKTRHTRFKVLVPLFAVLNLIFTGYLLFK